MKHVTDFVFTDPETLEHPFEFYAALRREAPVYKVPETGFYIVSRYDDIVEALRQPLLFSSKLGFGSLEVPDEVKEIYEKGGFGERLDTLVSNDPPSHTRYRALVDRAFTAERVSKMEDYIVSVVHELIDGFIDDGQVNIVDRFAIPVTMTVIADQLGVARDDMDKFKRWSDASVEPLGRMISKERHIECAKLVVEFQHYMHDRLEERRTAPRDDMLSEMLHARVEGERPLDTRELLSICQTLLVAGNETTTSAIASGVWLLATNPKEIKKLRGDEKLFGRLAEEVLRTESPVQGLFRMATQDTSLGGVDIPEGSIINLRYASANRDSSKFADPERFDVSRKDALKHLSFGQGIHHCIGHMLARQEIKCALRGLLERMDNIRFADPDFELEHAPSVILRAPKEIPIAFEKRA